MRADHVLLSTSRRRGIRGTFPRPDDVLVNTSSRRQILQRGDQFLVGLQGAHIKEKIWDDKSLTTFTALTKRASNLEKLDMDISSTSNRSTISQRETMPQDTWTQLCVK